MRQTPSLYAGKITKNIDIYIQWSIIQLTKDKQTKKRIGEKMYWKEILQFYEDMGVEDSIPIAHTRVKPNIKVLLDESGNFVGAMLNEQDRFTIPCTIESESRTSGCAPHPIHDNMQYLCDTYNDPKCKDADAVCIKIKSCTVGHTGTG